MAHIYRAKIFPVKQHKPRKYYQSMQVDDHDFAKFSLTPSVNLDVEIPEDMDGSFYDGQV